MVFPRCGREAANKFTILAPSCFAVSMAFFMIRSPAPSFGALAITEDKVTLSITNLLIFYSTIIKKRLAGNNRTYGPISNEHILTVSGRKRAIAVV
jgi:hypothetical protein